MSKNLQAAKSFEDIGIDAEVLDSLDSLDFERYLGIPASDNQYLRSKIDGTREWVSLDLTTNWGEIQGTLSNQTDLWSELQNRYLKSETFSQSEHISLSNGTSDAGKPIVLNTQGQIDPSMIDASTFYYVGTFDPSDCTDPGTGCEYPDLTGQAEGAFWVVDELTNPNGTSPDGKPSYTFDAGDLAGLYIRVGDFMVWGTAGWSIMRGEMNPLLYYKLDGSQAITGSFAGGNKQYKFMADGTEDQDGVNVRQLNSGLSGKANTVHTHEISDVTNLQTELDSKALQTDLDAVEGSLNTHVSDTANPHVVTKSQVGLGNVEDLAPADMPISDDTQAALNTKENYLGAPGADSGYFLTSDLSGTRSWAPVDQNIEWVDIDPDESGSPMDNDALAYMFDTKADQTDLNNHLNDASNPHSVTASQVNAVSKSGDTMTGNLVIEHATPNITLSDTDDSKSSRIVNYPTDFYIQTQKTNIIFSNTDDTELTGEVFIKKADGTHSFYHSGNDGSGSGLDADLLDSHDSGYFATDSDLNTHVSDTSNPHNVTKAQVGLDYVINSGDGSQYLANDGTYKTVQTAVWGNITGTLSNQTDLQAELDSKSDVGHGHAISDITDLQSTLDSKMDDSQADDYYLKTDFINESEGNADAGKPIVLNSSGKIDVSMMDSSSFYYVGVFDPSDPNNPDPPSPDGIEYPDTTGQIPGAFWLVNTLSNPNTGDEYTFQDGELQGQTISVGDFMVWGTAGWGIMAGEMNPILYMRIDKATPFLDNGNPLIIYGQLQEVDDASEARHAINKGQFDAHTSNTSNPHNVTASQVGADPVGSADVVQANLDTHEANTSNPHSVTASQVGADPVGSADAVQANLDTHTSDTANPHNVTKDQVSLGYVIDSGDGSQYLANDGTYKTPITDHNNLSGRDASDAHPISAVTDLQSTLDGKLAVDAKAADSNLLDGQNSDRFTRYITVYGPQNGILIQSDITPDQNVMFRYEIRGNGYSGSNNIFMDVQGYNYGTDGTILQIKGLQLGEPFDVDVFHYNGFLCFWLLPKASSQSFMFTLYDTTNGRYRPLTITDEAKPDPVDNNTPVPWTRYLQDTGTIDADTLDGLDSSDFALVGHNHDGVYLPMTGKAADSELLDGNDSTYFATQSGLDTHVNDTNNPHGVTTGQIGAEPSLGLGTAGQILATNSAADGKEWIEPPNSAVWGQITGDINNQTDLMDELNTKTNYGNQDGTDLNAFVTQGIYNIINAVNIPGNENLGALVVTNGNNLVTQTWQTANEFWYRADTGSGWGTWKKSAIEMEFDGSSLYITI